MVNFDFMQWLVTFGKFKQLNSETCETCETIRFVHSSPPPLPPPPPSICNNNQDESESSKPKLCREIRSRKVLNQDQKKKQVRLKLKLKLTRDHENNLFRK